jgi:hypothetical protein
MWQRVKCLVGKHVVRNHTVINEMGAVFHADICRACLRPWVGEFICNAWDDAQTRVVGNVHHLTGTNPILREGNFVFLGDQEGLSMIADLFREYHRMGVPIIFWE